MASVWPDLLSFMISVAECACRSQTGAQVYGEALWELCGQVVAVEAGSMGLEVVWEVRLPVIWVAVMGGWHSLQTVATTVAPELISPRSPLPD